MDKIDIIQFILIIINIVSGQLINKLKKKGEKNK